MAELWRAEYMAGPMRSHDQASTTGKKQKAVIKAEHPLPYTESIRQRQFVEMYSWKLNDSLNMVLNVHRNHKAY